MAKGDLKSANKVLIVMTGFIFVVSFSVYYVQNLIYSGDFCNCSVSISLLMVLLASLGLFTGSITYYLMIDSIVKRYRKETGIKKAIEPFLELLEKNERNIIIVLLKEKKVSQTSLAKSLSLNRVQVTRALQKLEHKNIIIKNKKGKTNSVELVSSIKSLFD